MDDPNGDPEVENEVHVFCRFLVLCLRKDLANRLASKSSTVEWNDLVRDLNELQEVQTTFMANRSSRAAN